MSLGNITSLLPVTGYMQIKLPAWLPRRAEYPFGVTFSVNGKNRIFLEIIHTGWNFGVEWVPDSLYFSCFKLALIFDFGRRN